MNTMKRLFSIFSIFVLLVLFILAPASVSGAQEADRVYVNGNIYTCLLYTSPSPRDRTRSRMPSSA